MQLPLEFRMSHEHRQLANSFLTNSKTARDLADLTLTDACQIQESLAPDGSEGMDQYAIGRSQMEEGKAEASAWWQITLSDLVKSVDKALLEDLQRRMER